MKSLILILITCSFNLLATTVDTNHSAALINPANQSDWDAMKQGLLSVLSKKSGLDSNKIDSKYSVDESFKPLVLRNYFENVPANYKKGMQWFNLVVNEEKVHQIMLDQGIPIWPDRRGKLFVWVVEEIEDQSLVSASAQSEAVYWLNKWFETMGVPTEFYDSTTQDLLAFQPRDVRYLNPDLIDFIQMNHEVSAVLMVFINHTGSGYSYRFGLAQTDKQIIIKNLKFVDLAFGLKSMAMTVQQIMAEGKRLYADEFNPSTVSITVKDLNEANQMLKLFSYLDQHALIDQYQASHLKSNRLQLMLSLKVLPDTFVKFVESEGLMEHVPLDLGQSILFNWVQ